MQLTIHASAFRTTQILSTSPLLRHLYLPKEASTHEHRMLNPPTQEIVPPCPISDFWHSAQVNLHSLCDVML